uniref:Actin-associated protein FAM107A n=1 Tax=Oncorhynchus kisutch TaxID=8019 RepID=A0A8C7I0R2_ONCKI
RSAAPALPLTGFYTETFRFQRQDTQRHADRERDRHRERHGTESHPQPQPVPSWPVWEAQGRDGQVRGGVVGVESKPELQRVLEARKREKVIKQRKEEDEARKKISPLEQELLKRKDKLEVLEKEQEKQEETVKAPEFVKVKENLRPLLRKSTAADFLRPVREKRAAECFPAGCSMEDSDAEELLEANSHYKDSPKMLLNGGTGAGVNSVSSKFPRFLMENKVHTVHNISFSGSCFQSPGSEATVEEGSGM